MWRTTRRLVGRLSPATWTILLALAALLVWALAVRATDAPYDRHEWLPSWADDDKNCRDTRQEVLARDAVPGTVKWDDAGCRVTSGWWRDPYSGIKVVDPKHLDVDHVVPLAWAHAHGGASWPAEKKQAFANDLGYRGALLAVSYHANRQKGDKGPTEWIPPRDGYFACEYGTYWAIVTTLWGLRLDAADRDAIRLLVTFCR